MFKKSLPISSKRTKKVDALPDIRNLFKLKKKNTIKNRVVADMKNLIKLEKAITEN